MQSTTALLEKNIKLSVIKNKSFAIMFSRRSTYMFYSEKLPLIVVISAFIIFAVCGLVTVLTTTHGGIKMDKYLCVSSIPSAYFYNDGSYTSKELYPREYIYDKNLKTEDICSYKKRDFNGELTLDKYNECKKIYAQQTKQKFANNECKTIGKEIYTYDNMECTALYVWGKKTLVSVSCEGSTPEKRKEAILKIQKKFK